MFQLTKSSFLRKACAHCWAIEILTLSINVIYIEHLYMTNINIFYLSLLASRTKTKSNISIKKKSERDSIGYKDL